MHIPIPLSKEPSMPMDSVHNYYERLVFNEVKEQYDEQFEDNEILADMACIALNQLPTRYIRFDIDMSFYMTTDEHVATQNAVKAAVKSAFHQVKKHSENKKT
jgi:DNA-binding protein YbaB